MCRGALCPHARRPQNLYESIRNEPFKIPEDDGNDLTHTFFNPDREGWLLKLGELGPALCPLPPAPRIITDSASDSTGACMPPPPEPGCHSPQHRCCPARQPLMLPRPGALRPPCSALP